MVRVLAKKRVRDLLEEVASNFDSPRDFKKKKPPGEGGRITSEFRVYSKKQPQPSRMVLTTECYIALVDQLVKARWMEEPYQSPELTWEHIQLWELVIATTKTMQPSMPPISADKLLADVVIFRDTGAEFSPPQLQELVHKLFLPLTERGPPRDDLSWKPNKRNRGTDRGEPKGRLLPVGQVSGSTTTSEQIYSEDRSVMPMPPMPLNAVPFYSVENTLIEKIEAACLSLNLNEEASFQAEDFIISNFSRARMYASFSVEKIADNLKMHLKRSS